MTSIAETSARAHVAVLPSMAGAQLQGGLRFAADGSVERSDGTVAHFSPKRFVEKICNAGHCFVCGKSADETPFNEEHIVPRWLLKRHGLFDKQILLPNMVPLKYRSYTVPCCTACNSLLGVSVEEPVSALLEAGYEAVREHLFTDGPRMLFAWMALVFLKTHLKDKQFRLHLDHRRGDARIADLHEWNGLHHVHCLARSLVQPTAIAPGVLGSFLCVRPRTDEHVEFDYCDLLDPKTAMLRTRDVALFCVFDDAGASRRFADPLLTRISEPPTALQLREMAAHIAFLNQRLAERPTFHTSFLESGANVLTSTVPTNTVLQPAEDSDFGAVLWRFFVDPLRGTSEWNEIEEPLRQGRYTFLIDKNGKPFSRR